MAQAEDTEVAPHQVHRHRQQRIAQVLAQQRHGVGAHVQGTVLGHEQVEEGDCHQRGEQHAKEDLG
jgi:hypothetical protein